MRKNAAELFSCEWCHSRFLADRRSRRYCSLSCSKFAYHSEHAVSPTDRFWSKVQRSADGCWRWSGPFSSAGYGAFKVGGKQVGAHRFAYELAKGTVARGLCVCHSCDNRWCVNPDHLTAASQAFNAADMAAKGRADRRPGEKHPLAKITDAQAQEIKARRRAGDATRDLAAEFSVAQKTIAAIAAGRTWRHVA